MVCEVEVVADGASHEMSTAPPNGDNSACGRPPVTSPLLAEERYVTARSAEKRLAGTGMVMLSNITMT